MNKLLKCAFGLLTLITLSIAGYSNADFQIEPLYVHSDPKITQQNILWNGVPGSDVFCIISTASQFDVDYNCDGNPTTLSVFESLCVNKSEYPTHGQRICISNGVGNYEVGVLYYSTSQLNTPFTSLQCQTEYNLIPISEVTPNYCKLNFDLIDPQECPVNEGTGAIVRSNLMINDIPYAQNQNINVFIPDFLAWNIAFNDFNTVIEVEGYNADEEYIENVINNEKLTPTNEDIENMLTGFMTNYFPYLALTILFLYLARKIYQIFK